MSKRTIVKDASYTAHVIDMVSIIIFNSPTDCTLTLPSPTGLIYADCDVHNKGAGTVTIGTQTVATGSHAHISNDGAAWVIVVGGGAEITKEAIEAVFTGEISSHYHRAQPQQWKDYPDSPDLYPGEKYQCIIAYPPPYGDNTTTLMTTDKEMYTGSNTACTASWYLLVGEEWQLDYHATGTFAIGPVSLIASNYDIYTNSSKTTLEFEHCNNYHVPAKAEIEAKLTGEIATHSHAGCTTHYEPVTNGNVTTPELIFYNGDVVMAEVNN